MEIVFEEYLKKYYYLIGKYKNNLCQNTETLDNYKFIIEKA